MFTWNMAQCCIKKLLLLFFNVNNEKITVEVKKGAVNLDTL